MLAVLVWSAPYKDAGMLKGPFGTLEEALAHTEVLVNEGPWDRAEIVPLGEAIVEVKRGEKANEKA